MQNLIEKYGILPTVLRYKDQITIMKDLISIGAVELSQDMDGMMFTLDLLMDSHQSNGVFEFKEEDRDVFVEFINLLRDIGKIIPEINCYIENGLVGTFDAFGFDALK